MRRTPQTHGRIGSRTVSAARRLGPLSAHADTSTSSRDPGHDLLIAERNGETRRRPVSVAIDATRALLAADDIGNRVRRVVPAR